MRVTKRQQLRQPADLEIGVRWEGSDAVARTARIRVRDFSETGMRLDSPVAIGVSKLIVLDVPTHERPVEAKVRYCVPREGRFQIGVEFLTPTRLPIRSIVDQPEYYEVLQLSPTADMETIHRVYRIMASRFHPDNPEGGDYERFLRISEAYHVLGDPERREEYDAMRRTERRYPLPMFQANIFVDDRTGELNRRLGVLCLLYQKRRRTPEHPGISLLELEELMSIPREYFDFTLWYLKEKQYVAMTQGADFSLTALGVDFVEAQRPAHEMLQKLLPTAQASDSRQAGAPNVQ